MVASFSSSFSLLTLPLLLLLILPHPQLLQWCESVSHVHTPALITLPSHTPDLISPEPLAPVPSTPGPSTSAPTTPASNTGLHSPGRREKGGGRPEHVDDMKGMRIVRRFYLWTQKNSGNSSAQLLDPTRPDTIARSTFRSRKTFIIIHGFLGWGTEPWILHLKDKLLRTLQSNVISVDWPAGTAWFLPSYYTAVGRVPNVAKDLTDLLNGLATTWNLDLKDVHLIGHSLGAHVAGLAAAPLETVGRISGLDPAGLTYHNVSPSQRLDPTDADYVDVIHTNGCNSFAKWLDCYGINENLGHSDFWPNGGLHQPACVKKAKMISNGEIGCSHEMAYMYYIESLDYSVDQTYYLARACDSWADYKAGNCSCGRETQYMGFSVNVRLHGSFYLATNSTAPYAMQDNQCLPGSATGPGVRIIEMALISATALIVCGAMAAGVVTLIGQRRSPTTEVPEREEGAGGADGGSGGGSGGNSGGGGGKDDVTVDVDDDVPLIH